MKIKLIKICSIFIIISVFTINYGYAEESIKFTSILKFYAGILTGKVIHEASHGLIATLTNTEIHWKLGNWNRILVPQIGFRLNTDNDLKGFAISSAGLLSSNIGSEIILQVDSINKNSAFTRGLMTWNIIDPIFYTLDYWIFHTTNRKINNTYYGDLKSIEHRTNKTSANVFASFIIITTVFQGYRFLKTQTWAPSWLKNEKYSINIKQMPSKELSLQLQFSF